MNSHARPSQLALRGAPGATPGHGSRLLAHFAARPQPRGSPHATEGFSSCNPAKGPCSEGPEGSWQGCAAGQHHPALRVFLYPDARRPTRASPLDTRATKHRLPPPAVENHRGLLPRAALSIQGPARLVSTTPPTQPGGIYIYVYIIIYTLETTNETKQLHTKTKQKR